MAPAHIDNVSQTGARRTRSARAEVAQIGHATRLSCPPRTTVSVAQAGHVTLPLSSISECRKSSCDAAKPLQMSSPLSAYGRVTVGGDGGLLDARMARASTISGGGLRGAECFVTYMQKLKSMGTI